MPEPTSPGGPGRDGRDARDETDERIRALLARAVASAPAPPTTGEILAPSPAAVPVVLGSGGPGWDHRRSPRSGTARMLGAVAASIAVVLLAVVGARTIGGSADDRPAMSGDGLPARFVPTDVPGGLRLTAVDLSPGPLADPIPEVTVYEGPDDVRVRVATGPTGWAARTAGPTPNGTPGTTPPGTAPPTTTPPTSSFATTTVPATPPSSTTTTSPPSPGTTGAPTTTVPALDVASLPSVPGVPGRPDIQATTIRGAVGGLEAHDRTTSTAWFLDRGQLVAVDVFGLDPVLALGLVERMTVGADGRLVPAPEDDLRRVASAPDRPAGAEPPASAQLVYTAAEGQVGGPAFVVTTTRLAPGVDDLLAATPGSFGRLERWGDRQVLVDDGLDNETTTRASFVDPAGVLVTVLGPTGDVRPYVDGLVAADEELWERTVADLRDRAGPDATTGAGTDLETSDTTGPPATTTATVDPPDTTGGPVPTGGPGGTDATDPSMTTGSPPTSG
jgi:hypothetical protein